MRIKKGATLVFIFLAQLVFANQLDRFVHLKESGILDPNYTNDSINQLLREGIESSNPEVVNLTIQSLRNLTYSTYIDAKFDEAKNLPERDIQNVPGLKGFLIEYWNIQHSRSGFNTKGQLESDLADFLRENHTISSLKESANRGTVEEVKIEDLESKIRESTSPWLSIPEILCAYWPKNDDVHRLIWSYYDKDRGLEPYVFLKLLNLGLFTSSRDNQYRIERLVAYRPGTGLQADREISPAAYGLALSHPEEAIPNLITAGLDHIKPRGDVLVTLSGYSFDQLDRSYSRLVSLVMVPRRTLSSDLFTPEEIDRAHSRLITYARNRNWVE